MAITQPRKLTQPLREEHAELVPHIAALAAAGDAVGRVGVTELRAMVDASYEFLADELIPHAHAEEAAQRIRGEPDVRGHACCLAPRAILRPY